MECTIRAIGLIFIFGMLFGAIFEFWIDVMLEDSKG